MMKNIKQLRLQLPTSLMQTMPGSDSESSPNTSPYHVNQQTSRRMNFKLSSSSGANLDLEELRKMRSARHQARTKRGAMQIAIKLIYKYQARSISELYDKSTADEYASLIYTGENFNNCVLFAIDLYVKDMLEIQRRDRWEYLLSCAKYNYEEESEIVRLFEVQNIDPVQFALDLKALLQCEHPKKNALKIYGVPDSGKSLLCQLISQCFITCYANNHGSENEFFLSNFLNKSLILCEELYVTQATCEDFKSILAGAPIDISKKFQEKQTLSRTPLLITSNYNYFGRGHLNNVDESALRGRCYEYHFTQTFTPTCMITAPSMYHFLWLCLNQDML